MAEQTQIIKSILDTTLRKMMVDVEEVVVEESELPGYERFIIVSPDTGILIGRGGEHLQALSGIVRKMALLSGLKEDYQFFIDVGDYQLNRIRETQAIARTMAERARTFNRNVEMEPMNAYERMIVHSTLAPLEGVTTESDGMGKYRRVVIKVANESVF